LKNIKKQSKRDLKRKQKTLNKKDKGPIDEEKKNHRRFQKIREKEFPKSHRTKG
jgi:hypothetical protein